VAMLGQLQVDSLWDSQIPGFGGLSCGACAAPNGRDVGELNVEGGSLGSSVCARLKGNTLG
jgi:hypothetical protein